MSAILFEALRTIGLTGCIVLGLLGYYEGVPWLRDVPFLGSIPIVGEIAVGRVQAVATRAVKTATADLVDKAELIEARALADELRRQRDFNADMAAQAQKAGLAARAEASAALQELEKQIAEDTDPDVSRWRAHDLERLHQH